MKEQVLGYLFAAIIIIGTLAGISYKYNECSDQDKTMVRGLFWFECVE
jgi:hypothetical protein